MTSFITLTPGLGSIGQSPPSVIFICMW